MQPYSIRKMKRDFERQSIITWLKHFQEVVDGTPADSRRNTLRLSLGRWRSSPPPLTGAADPGLMMTIIPHSLS